MHLRPLLLSAVSIIALSACGTNESQSDTSASSASKLPACQLSAVCSQTLPQLGQAPGFNGWYNKLLAKTGAPLHRARDIIAVPGEPLWIQAKFTYGLLDSDLHGEKVSIYLARDCASGLQKIGEATTSNDGDNAAVDGVVDSGGRIYANLADLGVKSLPIGRHRVVLVVNGDHSMTELYINIVDPRQKLVIADIDGTLTQSELAAAGEIVGTDNQPRPAAVDVMKTLEAKGYHIIYLTARPEWLMAKTREWLTRYGFPLGTVRTTTSKLPYSGQPAADFKSAELALFESYTGITPSLAFGNKLTDVEAYGNAQIPASGSFYHALTEGLAGGQSFTQYSDLLPTFKASAMVCQR